jgi:hypothetical protein
VYVGGQAPRRAAARVLDRQQADRALVLEETLGKPITVTDTPLPMVELHLD